MRIITIRAFLIVCSPIIAIFCIVWALFYGARSAAEAIYTNLEDDILEFKSIWQSGKSVKRL